MRRASYGPKSPMVGPRGQRTRRKILDAAISLFEQLGYAHASVDAIARAAGVSRATLYQYFAGESEIFDAVAAEGFSALTDLAESIPPLGNSSDGFRNLRRFLDMWAEVFREHAAILVEIDYLKELDTERRQGFDRVGGIIVERISRELVRSGYSEGDARTAAVITLSLTSRVLLYVYTGRSHDVGPGSAIAELAAFLQCALFPDTPLDVTTTSTGDVGVPHEIVIPPTPVTAGRTLVDRTSGHSERAAQTVRAIVRAGTYQFSCRGYASVTVADVVETLGSARSTFYDYFRDKADLLDVIVTDTVIREVEFAEARDRIHPVLDRSGLLAWLAEFTAFAGELLGHLDLWSHRHADGAIVLELGRYSQAKMDSALASLAVRAAPARVANPVVSALICRALIYRVPESLSHMTPPLVGERAGISAVDFLIRGLSIPGVIAEA